MRATVRKAVSHAALSRDSPAAATLSDHPPLHHDKKREKHMERRRLLSRLALLSMLGVTPSVRPEESKKPLKIMFKSAWGSDDPTKAAFAFLHGNALAEAGMAAARRSSREGGSQQGPDLRVRCLFARARNHRLRSLPVGCQVRKPYDICVTCRVGGSDHHGVTREPPITPRLHSKLSSTQRAAI